MIRLTGRILTGKRFIIIYQKIAEKVWEVIT